MSVHDDLSCIRCGRPPEPDWAFGSCPHCLEEGVTTNYTTSVDVGNMTSGSSLREDQQPGIWRYRSLYPVNRETEPVSLQEGGTPLVRLNRLGEQLGLPNLYVKDESRNPTWSHKDRLCSVGVTKAKEFGARVITVSSTGNHGASTAAYAARAGLPCVAFTTTSVPQTMKTLMQSYGAMLVATPTPRDRWTLMEHGVRHLGWYPMSGFVYPPIGSNPYAIDGYKSIAVELIEDLQEVPDKILVPTAYADALLGIWKGFMDLKRLNVIDKLPQLIAIEPFGPLAKSMEQQSLVPLEVPAGPSVAFSVATPVGTFQGLKALYESGGSGYAVSDALTIQMQQRLAREEGLFAEASSAMAVAAVEGLLQEGRLNVKETVVVLLTSTGLKDPAAVAEYLPPVPLVQPDVEDLARVMAETYAFELGTGR
jgi:threonine synthase